MATIREAMAAAVQHHQAGQLAQAAHIYQRILKVDPRQPDALHLIGVVWHQSGRHEEAVAQIQQAIALRPNSASFHNNLGNALQALARYQEAERAYRKAIDLNPDFADAYNNLANALRRLVRPSEAIAAFEKALQLKPEFPQALNNLGNAWKDQDRLDEAKTCYERSLHLHPDYAEAHNNLGTVLHALGEVDRAIASYERALQLDPQRGEIHGNLGNALQEKGKLDEAIACYQRAIELCPNSADHFVNWAKALHKTGQLDEAAVAFRKALQRKPDSTDAYTNLGNVLREQWKLEEATAVQEQAVAIQPDSETALNNLGVTRKAQGQFEEAIACFEAALQINPSYIEAHVNLGNVRQELGQPDEAVRHYNHVLDVTPCHPRVLHQLSGLTKHKHYAFSDEKREEMRQALTNSDLKLEDASLIHYALANLLDQEGDYDAAFQHYHQGNRLMREALTVKNLHEVDPEQLRKNVDDAISVFTRDFFKQRKPHGLDTELPVFIVGMPRSGTTLVEQILASHPQVFGAGELREILQMSKQIDREWNQEGGYPRCLASLDADSLRGLGERHLMWLKKLGGAALRVVDKMPLNYHHLGLIATLFPQARVIHCHRDSLDTCLSSFMQSAIPTSLEELGLCYREYQRLMSHWRQVLPCPLFEVDYEDLVREQERISREMVAFCGLSWTEECLMFHKTNRPVQTPSKLQVRQPIYNSSIGRWKNYRDHLQPLIEALGLDAEGGSH